MQMQCYRQGASLYVYLDGELDEHTVAEVRARTDLLIDEHASASRAVFNLANVRFMDSTGIGYLIGRYKRLQRYGIGMFLENPNAGADKILSLSGVYTLMPKI
ncbi:MAG: anti-sigma factor antagonist [Clostridia bacterium]|nr:anti-sigma factor antagonist [Clostridia bacterium]